MTKRIKALLAALAISASFACGPAYAGLDSGFYENHSTYDWAHENKFLDGLVVNNVHAKLGNKDMAIRFDTASWDAYFAAQKQIANPGARDLIEPFDESLLALGSFWQGYQGDTFPGNDACKACVDEFTGSVKEILIRKAPGQKQWNAALAGSTLVISVGTEEPSGYSWLLPELTRAFPHLQQYFKTKGWL